MVSGSCDNAGGGLFVDKLKKKHLLIILPEELQLFYTVLLLVAVDLMYPTNIDQHFHVVYYLTLLHKYLTNNAPNTVFIPNLVLRFGEELGFHFWVQRMCSSHKQPLKHCYIFCVIHAENHA